MENLSVELRERQDEYEEVIAALREVLDENKIADIEQAMSRLEDLQISIAVFGETNAGKSALLNSLFGRNNDDRSDWLFEVDAQINHWSADIENNNGVLWQEVAGLDVRIFDTPGIAGDFLNHLETAKSIAGACDIILYVMSQQVKGELQVTAIKGLLSTGKPLIGVVNKTDLLRESEVEAIVTDLKTKTGIASDFIIRTAGHPRTGPPVVGELTAKVVSIVDSRRGELIETTIQNKLKLGIDEAQEILRQRMEAERRRQEEIIRAAERDARLKKSKAEDTVGSYAKAAAGAAALIPFGIDAITSTLVTGGMFWHVGRIYDKELDARTVASIGKELVQAFISILFVSAATLTAYLAISKGAKSNPFTYALGMALDGTFTYFIVSAVGNTFAFYCANDLTWGSKETAAAALKDYVAENVDRMFLNKLPEKYRASVKEKINPELL